LPHSDPDTYSGIGHFEGDELSVHLYLLEQLIALLGPFTIDLNDQDYGWSSSEFMREHSFLVWMWSPVGDEAHNDPRERRTHHTLFEIEGWEEKENQFFSVPLTLTKEAAWELCQQEMARIQIMAAQ